MVDFIQNIQSVYNKLETKTQESLKCVSPPPVVGISTSPKPEAVDVIEKQIKKNGINSMRQHWSHGAVSAAPAPTRTPNSSQLRWRQQDNFKYASSNLTKAASSLASFKCEPTLHAASGKRPYVGLCCEKCLSSSRNSFVDDVVRTFGLNNLLLVPTMNQNNGFIIRKFHYLAHVFNCRTFYKYPDVSDDVLLSARVLDAVEKAASQETEDEKISPEIYPMLLQKHMKRARIILTTMKSRVSSNLLSFIQWMVFKFLSRLLRSVQVHKGQLEILKRASKASLPLIFIPLHRSHLDYILVTFILVNNKIKAPLVAAGDNLRIPIIGRLLRGLGAFFIKRKMTSPSGQNDHVYKAILHTYVENSLRAGHNLEFFIEGGRSRTGKSCIPKAGLLSVIVATYMDGSIPDALIVPVAINYEKIMDGNFLSEQLGNPKQMESLSSVFRAFWRVINSNFGHVRVDFAQPFSLTELMQSIQSKGLGVVGNTMRLLSPDSCVNKYDCQSSSMSSDTENRMHLVKFMAEHVTYDATHCMSIMTTNLLSFLLLNKFRQGGTKQQIIHAMTWLLEEIRLRGRDFGFDGDARQVVEHAISIMGPKLIEEHKVPMETPVEDVKAQIVVLKPVTDLPYVIELAYYSNVVLSAFLMDGVLAAAVHALVEEDLQSLRDCDSKLVISREKLHAKAKLLCDILQYDFIFTPFCSDLDRDIITKIEKFISDEILSPVEQCDNSHKQWARRFVSSLDWDEGRSDDDEDEFINLTDDALEKLEFYTKILSPIIESYWLFACNISLLLQVQMEEKEFLKRTRLSISNKIAAGLVLHAESLSADALQNAAKLFENWKVIESCVHDNVKLVYLSEYYDDEERLVEIIEIIEEFKQ
uniref:Phospholipid/glycerol acyltransferase domain-containing protein n=1 Tax=Strigamia maritima TaxID=126957 RepID=T1JMC2_STRMM